MFTGTTCSLISFQEKPKVFLTLEELAKENTPNFGTELKDEDIPPLFVSDVQSLILFAVQGSACKIKPRYNCLLLFLERGFTLNWSVTLASHIRVMLKLWVFILFGHRCPNIQNVYLLNVNKSFKLKCMWIKAYFANLLCIINVLFSLPYIWNRVIKMHTIPR